MARQTNYYKPMPRAPKAMYESHRDFLHQQLTVADLVGGDPRYAYFKAAFYFVFAPYVTGVLVMLAFSAKGNLGDLFTILGRGGFIDFFMMWAIGYEVLASMFLLWTLYMVFTISRTAA